MTLFLCTDERGGMAFNRRRQSRDRAVYADIASLAAGHEIVMDARSVPLFEGTGAIVREGAADADFVFCEFVPPSSLPCPDCIVLYCWNRHYPADLHFDIPLSGWTLIGEVEFAGSSHERITRRTYIHG